MKRVAHAFLLFPYLPPCNLIGLFIYFLFSLFLTSPLLDWNWDNYVTQKKKKKDVEVTQFAQIRQNQVSAILVTLKKILALKFGKLHLVRLKILINLLELIQGISIDWDIYFEKVISYFGLLIEICRINFEICVQPRA